MLANSSHVFSQALSSTDTTGNSGYPKELGYVYKKKRLGKATIVQQLQFDKIIRTKACLKFKIWCYYQMYHLFLKPLIFFDVIPFEIQGDTNWKPLFTGYWICLCAL